MHSRIAFDEGWTVTTPQGYFDRILGIEPPVASVRLPHDAMRDAPRSPDAPSGGSTAFHLGGVWRYEKSFDVPAEWADSWVNLTFDGAYANAKVSVNGVLIAQRPNGYARFHVDLTPHLRFGRPNTVRVDVRTHLDSRWYSGAGLHREVGLTVAGGVHLAPDGLTVLTPEVDDEYAGVEVVTRLTNDLRHTVVVDVMTSLLAPDGVTLVTDRAPATVPAGGTVAVRRRLWIADPHRWSVDDPAQHTAVVSVASGEEVFDEASARFGVRTVRIDPFRGLRINDVPTKLRGACLHHDNGVLGGASHRSAERRRVRLLKEAGFNALRMSHHPASQALLDACDELGMLMVNEAFDMWGQEKTQFDYARDFATWWRADVDAMVAGSVNHPSVIAYSIGNEIPELARPDGRITGRALAEHVRALDSSRPVTHGMQILFLVDAEELIRDAGGLNELLGGLKDRRKDGGQGFAAGQNAAAVTPQADAAIAEICSVLDVVGYNYAEDRYAHDAAHHPQRVSFGSETFPTRIAGNWAEVLRHPAVLGDFTWTGWDYLGEAGIGRTSYTEEGATFPYGLGYPNLTASCGDHDVTGRRLPISYYREIVFGLREEPYLAVFRPEHHGHTIAAPNAWQWTDTVGSWTWPGHEGAPVQVEVYARAATVELLLDGHSLGTAAVGEERQLVARFETTYAPGELTAVAYSEGVEVGRTTLASAGRVAAVAAYAEQAEVSVGADDLAYVPVHLTDVDGVPTPGEDRAVTVRIDGPGVLAGFGTGANRTDERFDATTRTTHDGRALAVVRALAPGAITVHFSSDGLAPAEVSLTAGP